MTTIQDRETKQVQAGAALLDKKLPNWWDGKDEPTIDLKILDMEDPNMCMLGQCFGWYESGCRKLGIPAWSSEFKKGKPNAKTLGFLATGAAPWRREIKRRRRNA